MRKRGLLYFIFYTVVLIINMVIVLINKDSARVSNFSLPSILLMIIMIIHAIVWTMGNGRKLLFLER